jgi:hypothetical protein
LLKQHQAVEAIQTIGDAFTSNFISSFASYCDACIYSKIRSCHSGVIPGVGCLRPDP